MQFIRKDPARGYIDTRLWIPKKLVNVEGVKNALTFELYDKDVVRYLTLWEETEHHVVVPRAFWKYSDFQCEVVDCRPQSYKKTGIKSRIKLDHVFEGGVLKPTGKTVQREALAALMESTGGTLQLGCGKGKSVIALELAAHMQVPTLIVVDNTHLLLQWQQEIERHLKVPGGVGLIQGPVKDWNKGIVMATYQTLAMWAADMPEEARLHFGLVIWDEGHHVNAPVFSLSASLFYGKRISLSATPKRQDGMHVICQHHVGPIIYKDVRHDLIPKIFFRWTGLELDKNDPTVAFQTNDVTGELHLGKLAVFFGQWRKRLIEVVLPEVEAACKEGRKVLVLSNSVDEVINLMTLWTMGPDARLYTDIPIPTKDELGLDVEPEGLTPKDRRLSENTIREIYRNLDAHPHMPPVQRELLERKLEEHKAKIASDNAYKKVQKVLRTRQRQFLKSLLEKDSKAGLFTEAVKPAVRHRMLKERRVIFAIMKYGKEGLDDKDLDTVIMSQPVSDRNTIQQVMGRPTRRKEGKRPVLVVLEDNIGPLISQCVTLRKHFKQWPADEGGPFKYELLGHPSVLRMKKAREQWTKRALEKAGI